jgi:hypothetical protein
VNLQQLELDELGLHLLVGNLALDEFIDDFAAVENRERRGQGRKVGKDPVEGGRTHCSVLRRAILDSSCFL